ncbi:ParB/RepB/Spo0J family partition protein [Mycolicibacterium sp. S3B2]|uniref:ParB/RepB/Spo0J family partition protein n=1 Tax=Mycolicibacterium sp. S3B2 TaxID=3415120 RepID=UPI003C7CD1DE
MARGKRTSLADLATAVGDHSPVDEHSREQAPARSAALSDLTANPRNPRDDLGDLDDLASIADLQLQPASVVTKRAYLHLFPEDSIHTPYVVVNGCRRLAAAKKFGRPQLDITVNDAIARDRVTFIAAAIAENVDRQGFDVIEEAKAVQALVAECGSADVAADKLRKSPTWVSHRRALLELAPELQTALRKGELALRDARQLARVPRWQQVERWKAALDRENTTDPTPNPANHEQRRRQRQTRVVTTALGKFDDEPALLASALREYLGDTRIATLVALLNTE